MEEVHNKGVLMAAVMPPFLFRDSEGASCIGASQARRKLQATGSSNLNAKEKHRVVSLGGIIPLPAHHATGQTRAPLL